MLFFPSCLNLVFVEKDRITTNMKGMSYNYHSICVSCKWNIADVPCHLDFESKTRSTSIKVRVSRQWYCQKYQATNAMIMGGGGFRTQCVNLVLTQEWEPFGRNIFLCLELLWSTLDLKWGDLNYMSLFDLLVLILLLGHFPQIGKPFQIDIYGVHFSPLLNRCNLIRLLLSTWQSYYNLSFNCRPFVRNLLSRTWTDLDQITYENCIVIILIDSMCSNFVCMRVRVETALARR